MQPRPIDRLAVPHPIVGSRPPIRCLTMICPTPNVSRYCRARLVNAPTPPSPRLPIDTAPTSRQPIPAKGPIRVPSSGSATPASRFHSTKSEPSLDRRFSTRSTCALSQFPGLPGRRHSRPRLQDDEPSNRGELEPRQRCSQLRRLEHNDARTPVGWICRFAALLPLHVFAMVGFAGLSATCPFAKTRLRKPTWHRAQQK